MKSFVYIGTKDAPESAFYVKVGKTNHPEKRLRAYATHSPGGLSHMYYSQVETSAAAFAVEARLLARMRAMPGVRRCGGEWFVVSSAGLDEVFSALIAEAGEPERIGYRRGCRVYDWE